MVGHLLASNHINPHVQNMKSPFLSPYICFNISLENLVVHRWNIKELMILFILTTCLALQ